MIQLFFFSNRQRKTRFFICSFKKEAYFLFIYMYIYILFINVSLHSSRAGTVHTHQVQRHATLALLLHSTVGWLAGVMSSRRCCSRWVYLNTHTHTHLISLHPTHTVQALQPGTSLIGTLPGWHQSKGRGLRFCPTSFKWSNKSSAARLCGACRDGQEMGVAWGKLGSKVRGGFRWKV